MVLDPFTLREVAEINGYSPRIVSSWVERKHIKPDIRVAEGPGSRNLFSFRNLLEVRVIRMLRGHDATVDLTSIKEWLDRLREIEDVESIIRYREDVEQLGAGMALVCDPDGHVHLVEADSQDKQYEEWRLTHCRIMGVGIIAGYLVREVKAYRASSPEERRNGTWRNRLQSS